MTAEALSETFRGLADKIDLYAALHAPGVTDVSGLLDEDVQFAAALRRLCDLLPESWRRVLRGWQGNRVYRQLLNSTAIDELGEEVVAIIWSWVDDMDSFFHGAVTAPGPHGSGSGVPLLDSVCGMLQFIKTQSAVDRIRWRLLLYFLARLVDERISHVGDEDELVDLLVQYGWISEGLKELLKAHLRDWLKAGRNYVELARALGGAGTLLCLPLWGPSAWEHHCHPGGEYWLAIVGHLRELGVPMAAQQKRHQGYTAYDVATAVIDHCFARCPTGFLSGHRSLSQRLPAGRRIRKRRRGSGPPRRRRQTRRR